MNPLRRAESDQHVSTGEKSATSMFQKQQVFILDSDFLRSTAPNGKPPRMPAGPLPEKTAEVTFAKRRSYDESFRSRSANRSKYSTVVFNSLGAVKLFQIAFAAAVVGCLWSQCRFTYYASGYCYGPASAFQLQNFPLFVCLVSIIVNLGVLLSWVTTWEQASSHSLDNKSKRKKVAQVDTMCSFVFVLLSMGCVIVEIWMVIKFNQGYSCPMCYTSALWIIATACLIANMALYIYNISLCLQQRRLNTIMRVRF